MARTSDSPGLNRLAVVTAVVTLGLICVGGLVTSNGAGLAVPDWPTSYGDHMFLFPVSKWNGGIFYEHTHRLLASLVGLFTAGLSGWIWARETQGWPRWIGLTAILTTLGLMGVRTQPMFVALAVLATGVIAFSFSRLGRDERPMRWWAAIAFAAVLIQGVLGGLRVTELKDEIGIFHGMVAQLFFVLICALALSTSRWWQNLTTQPIGSPGLRHLYLGVTILVLIQLALGATMRHQHAGLAIPDFPLAYGKVWPDLSTGAVAGYNARRVESLAQQPITAFGVGLHMVHRLMALLIAAAVIVCARRARQQLGGASPLAKLSLAWVGLVFIQIGLGAATIWTDKSADLATAHVAVGALILMTGALQTLIAFRRYACEREKVVETPAVRAQVEQPA